MSQKKLVWMKVPTNMRARGMFTEADGHTYTVVSTPVSGWAQVLRQGDEDLPGRPSKSKKVCECRSSAGEPKKLYPSRTEAIDQARRRGWASATYRCPRAKGYHLTKS